MVNAIINSFFGKIVNVGWPQEPGVVISIDGLARPVDNSITAKSGYIKINGNILVEADEDIGGPGNSVVVSFIGTFPELLAQAGLDPFPDTDALTIEVHLEWELSNPSQPEMEVFIEYLANDAENTFSVDEIFQQGGVFGGGDYTASDVTKTLTTSISTPEIASSWG